MARLRTDVPLLVDSNGDVAVSVGMIAMGGNPKTPATTTMGGGVFEENNNMRFYRSLAGDGGIVFDSQGNVYMGTGIRFPVGVFSPDIIFKLDSWGRQIWSGQTIFDLPPGYTGNGGSNRLTLDRNGDLLLAGRGWQNNTDFWKLNGKTGQLIWGRLSGMEPTFGLRDIATDSENNVVVVGSGQNEADHFIVKKYDSSGQFLWGRTVLPPRTGPIYPEARNCCIDNDDNIYVSVSHFQGQPGGSNVIGVKYDKFGNELYKMFPPASLIAGEPDIWNFLGFGIACDNNNNWFHEYEAQNGFAVVRDRGIFSGKPNGSERWDVNVLEGLNNATGMFTDSANNLFLNIFKTGPGTLMYVDGSNGDQLTIYPLHGRFPLAVNAVSVSRPNALIGPVMSGRSNLLDSGHYLNYTPRPFFPPGFPVSSGDVLQEPGDINKPDDQTINIEAGLFRAKDDYPGPIVGNEINNSDLYDRLSSSIILPAPAWAGINRYLIGDTVFHNSVFYECIQAHVFPTPVEPGVDADWEDFWAVTSSPTQPYNSIEGLGGFGFHDPLDPENTTPQWYTAAFAGIQADAGGVHILNGVYQCGKIHGGHDSQWRHLKYKPRNNTVHVKFTMEPLTSRIQLLFEDDSAADWLAGSRYFISDLVYHNSILYSCIQSHSTPAIEPRVTPTWANFWEQTEVTQAVLFDFTVTGGMGALLKLFNVDNELSAGGIASVYPGEIAEWSAEVEYEPETIVGWQGRFYRTLSPVIAIMPPSGAWQQVT